jgi:hypothetical protein
MFQKFLIDNAIKIITTICGLLVSAGIFIGTQQVSILNLKDKVKEQELTIKADNDKLIILDWYVKNHDPRIDRLEDIEKKK